jgi:RNA polymerase sigma-70 factor (ECF subfamily)
VLDPEDVMQVTYLEAFLRMDEFKNRGPGSFPAWLREIAQNNLRDAIKGLNGEKRPPPHKRVDPPRGEDSVVALYELLGVTSTTPSRAAARGEAKSRLEKAIEELPEDYATAVRLHNLEGRTGPEVAEAMGRSRGAVFMLLARAHDRLRERLGTASQFFSTRGL